MLRSAAFAFAAVIAALAAPAQAPAAQAEMCDAMTMRVYFEHGSATLTPAATQALDVAARTMSGCTHKEMRVTIGAGRLASVRGAAIITAMTGRGFDVAELETRSMTQMAPMSSAPEFVEVQMASELAPTANLTRPMSNAGV